MKLRIMLGLCFVSFLMSGNNASALTADAELAHALGISEVSSAEAEKCSKLIEQLTSTRIKMGQFCTGGECNLDLGNGTVITLSKKECESECKFYTSIRNIIEERYDEECGSAGAGGGVD